MSEFHQLSTQQYVEQAAEIEAKMLRDIERRESIKLMAQFGFAVVVLGLSMFAVYTMPNWLPQVNAWLDQAGILEG